MNPLLHDLLHVYSRLPEWIGLPVPETNTANSFGKYPIHVAATRLSQKEVAILLEGGANVNQIGEDGFTPLHCAVEQGGLEMVRFLIDRGANPALKDAENNSPVELAKLLGEVDIESFLLSAIQ